MNSLGFTKEPAQTRVVVAMSGGVDSSVTAALLKEQGYDVVGVTLQLYDNAVAAQRKGSCCAGIDIYDASRVAEKIGIPHYVLDFENKFSSQVMDDFADSYLRGETPVPCIHCNQSVKFGDLLKVAKDLGAEAMATGHYVRRTVGADGSELRQAVDTSRDQSYFLFSTSREQLDFLRFPLGDIPSKQETRALAEKYGLQVAAKPDSQDICFVPDGDYAAVVNRLRPGSVRPGQIVDQQGRLLGIHDGIIHFTVGQRRGLNLQNRVGENNEPLFVIRLDAAQNRVVVGPREALAQTTVFLRNTNWLTDVTAWKRREVTVRLRSSQKPLPAWITPLEGNRALIELQTPAPGVAPGQAGVVYEEDRVLGGGWLEAPKAS